MEFTELKLGFFWGDGRITERTWGWFQIGWDLLEA